MTTDRQRLPDERLSITRRFTVAKPSRAHDCPSCKHRWEEPATVTVYVTVGLYPDGAPGELFIVADKVGSTTHGALDAAAMAISVGLQHGVPLEVFLNKLIGTRYGAGGFTGDADYPSVTSILDGVARWMRDKFCKVES